MGRKPTIQVSEGDVFGRWVVVEVSDIEGKRAAKVRCSGDHEPVERLVQLASLTSGASKSCGCLNREVSAQRARERNATGPQRLGTGKKGLPPRVKYIKKEVPYGSVINDEGRQCGYKGEGSCGQQFKPWAEFNKGNTARGHSSWCRACARQHHQNSDPVLRREYSLTTRLKAFGLTVEQYRVLEARYGGRCWLCRQAETVSKNDEVQRLGVDHDHGCCDFDPTPQHRLCGKCIRGLACHRCNRRVLGEVDRVGFEKVAAYFYAGYVVL